MIILNDIVNDIINGKTSFCCLCVKTIVGKPIHIQDEVVVNFDDAPDKLTVLEILRVVLGEKIAEYLKAFNYICDQCIKAAVNSYLFIETTKKNTKFVNNIVNALTTNFEMEKELDNIKSIYVCLNEDFSTTEYYDSKRRVITSMSAMKRLASLLRDRKCCRLPVSKHPVSIKTSEMLFDIEDPTIKCKVCFKVYQTYWNLRTHYIRVHAPKSYKCPDCSRSYGSPGILEAHRTESHCKVVCRECGKTFTNRHTLKMHEASHNFSLVCPNCGRVYKSKFTYKKHKELNICGQKNRASPSNGRYTCDYCNKKYTQKVSLRVHIQYEHGNYKAHICEWCGKKFSALSRLNAHIVKHTREKKYPCKLCDGKFVSKASLLYHTRTHTGEKPYKCPHCTHSFITASRRLDHVKRHHDGGTFQCDVCHSNFTCRNYLLKHMQVHKAPRKVNFISKRILKTKVVDKKKTNEKYEPLHPKVSYLCGFGNRDQNLAATSVSEDGDMPIFSHEVYGDADTDSQNSTSQAYLDVANDMDEFALKLI